MSTRDNVSFRAGTTRNADGSNANDLPVASRDDVTRKRAVPDGLRQFLAWDAELTTKVTSFLEKSFPNLTKSETKFMEVICCFIINIYRVTHPSHP